MSEKAPAFFNKPNHKGTVVATARGWVVQETGEILVSVKNLDQRIAEHLGLSVVQLANVDKQGAPIATAVFAKAAETPAEGDNVDALLDSLLIPTLTEVVETPSAVVEAPVVPEVVKPRRGRPPKIRPEAEVAKTS